MSFLVWLEQSGLSVWIRESETLWAFPFILLLHTLGLGIVAGFSVAMNLWILRFAKRHPMAPMQPFFPVVWVGFVINLVSGILLLIAYPTKALTNPLFYLKIVLTIAALWQLQWTHQRIFVAGDPTQPLRPSRKLRALAGVSFTLWAGAVLTGRLLAYTYNYLTAADLLLVY